MIGALLTEHRTKVTTDIRPTGLTCYIPQCSCGWEGSPQIIDQHARNEGSLHQRICASAEERVFEDEL